MRSLFLAFILLFLVVFGPRAQATDFLVTSLADSGPGTLRDAVNSANAANTDDTIRFDALAFAQPQTLTLTAGTFVIANAGTLTVVGPLAPLTLRSINKFPIFGLYPGQGYSGANLTLTGLNLTSNGGAVVDTSCTLTANNCSFVNNTWPKGTGTSSGSGTSYGLGVAGAICVTDATLNVEGCTFDGNSVDLEYNGSYSLGGAIWVGTTNGNSKATINGSTFSNNSVANLSTATRGGAICSDGNSSTAINNCTFVGNSTSFSQSSTNAGAITALGNSAVALDSCTLTGNSSNSAGGIGANSTTTLAMNNTIVAGNTGQNGPDISGQVSGSYNLVQNTQGTRLSGSYNITGQDARLGQLTDNGGTLQTCALLTGSPAIDAGNSALRTDERGGARPYRNSNSMTNPVGNNSDIGAYEVQNGVTISTIALSPSTPATNDVLTANIVVANQRPNELITYSYIWKKNGNILAGETSSTLNLAQSGNGDKGDVITVKVIIRINGGGSNGSETVTSTSTKIVNTPPFIDAVSITHDDPAHPDVLSASVASISDADSDILTTSYQWKKNGQDIPGATNSTYDLSQAGGTRSDTLSVVVSVFDGQVTSSRESSRTVSYNRAPVVHGLTFDNTAPKTNDMVTAIPDVTDADGDTLVYTYVWRRNGVVIEGATRATLDLSQAGYGDHGDQITATLQASDGITTSNTLTSAPFVVVNSAPVLPGVTITPKVPRLNSVLGISAAPSDLDNDSLATTYQWKKNGQAIVGATSATLDLSQSDSYAVGDQISVVMTVSDGQDSVTSESGVITLNTKAPVVTSVSIAPTNPKTTDTLTASATSTVSDNAPVTYSFVWRKNGQIIAGESASTLDLSKAGYGDHGDQITATATANDGLSDGPSLSSAAVTVDNSVPSVSSVALTPTAPRTGQTLTATVRAVDPDNDALTYTFTWTRVHAGNSNVVRTQSGKSATDSLTPAVSPLTLGDKVTVSVVVSDGAASSQAKSATATIANTPVSIGSFVVTPGSPRTNSVLVASAQISDADGSRLANNYVWTRIHNGRASTVFSETTTNTQSRLDLSKVGKGDKGDTIKVTLTASDGASKTSKSVSVLVGNSAPTLTGLKLSPASPTLVSKVTATFTASDLDVTDQVDTFKYLYTWKVGSKALSAEKSATVDLSQYPFLKVGDTLSLEMRVSDGTVLSPVQRATVKIGGTPHANGSINGSDSSAGRS